MRSFREGGYRKIVKTAQSQDRLDLLESAVL